MISYNTHGALLKLGDGGGPEVFTAIAGLKDWNMPERMIQTFGVTTHTDGAARLIAGKVVKVGKITAKLVFDPGEATHANAGNGLEAVFNAKAIRNWKGVFPAAANKTWSFAGVLSRLGQVTMAVDGSLEMDIDIDVDGDVTIS